MTPLPRVWFVLLLMAAFTPSVSAEPAPANSDEARVPPYELPDVLRCADGTAVASPAVWEARRRPELLEWFAANVYGRTPGGRPATMHWEETAPDPAALGGRAVRREITVWLGEGRSAPFFRLLVFQPAGSAPGGRGWPVFLGLNFFGNHTVADDPGIALADPFTHYDTARYRVAEGARTSDQRGVDAGKWPVAALVARGYAVATIHRADFCPDTPEGLRTAVAAWFRTGGAEERAEDAWGAVGIWAWGLSRALDVLERDPAFDARRVAVHGFSRLGKAALWAAAQDRRFALLVSFQSGCGGAALNKRVYGETPAIINTKFPHWFARSFRRFNDREADLPVDQHALLALVAPRPVLVTSAEGDQWSDPRGEFLSAQAASAVWRLHGRAGIGDGPLPGVGQPAGDAVRYFIRGGKHDVTAEDWAVALDFADRWLR